MKTVVTTSAIILWVLVLLFSSLFIADKITSPVISPIEREFPTRTPYPYFMFKSAGEEFKLPVIPKPDNEFRILMIGGSTVAKGSPALPKLLENLINNPNVKVYNFGSVSSVSGSDLTRLVFEGIDVQPDFVISYSGANDIICPWYYDPRPGYPHNFTIYEHNPFLVADNYPMFEAIMLGNNFLRKYSYNYLTKKLLHIEELRNEVGYGTDEWRQQIAIKYVSNMVKMRDICSIKGIKFVAFFQPLVVYKDPLQYDEEHMIEVAYSDFVPYAIDMRERIRQQINLQKIKVIDLSNIHDGNSEYIFSDLAHVSQVANEETARTIYNYAIGEIYD